MRSTFQSHMVLESQNLLPHTLNKSDCITRVQRSYLRYLIDTDHLYEICCNLYWTSAGLFDPVHQLINHHTLIFSKAPNIVTLTWSGMLRGHIHTLEIPLLHRSSADITNKHFSTRNHFCDGREYNYTDFLWCLTHMVQVVGSLNTLTYYTYLQRARFQSSYYVITIIQIQMWA